MRFSEFVGNRDLVRRLQKRAEEKRPFHAYVFEGADGVGKRRLAFTLAQALVCENPKDGEPCGHCPSCRKVETQNHTDVIYVTSDGNSLKEEVINDLRKRLYEKPFDGPRTILIIDRADLMTNVAQNMLLKTLEEPAETLNIILLSENSGDLLPTIVSRAHLLRLKPVAPAVIQRFLVEDHGAGESEAIAAAAYSGGSPGRALRLLKDETFREKRRLASVCALALRAAASPAEFYPAVEAFTKFSEDADKAREKADRERLKADKSGFADSRKEKKPTWTKKEIDTDLLDMLLRWYRDVLLISEGLESACMNADSIDRLRETGSGLTKKQILNILNKIEEAKTEISMNGSRAYVWKNLFLQTR